jgi:hypothetical protein
MPRLRSVSALGPEHTIISFRLAAETAKKMRAQGWPVTGRMLARSTPYKVARKIAPRTDPDAPGRIAVQIARLAGFLPAEEEKP